LSVLMIGRPSVPRLSTRIVVVQYSDDSGHSRQLGLIAEKATQTVRRDAAEFVDSGVSCRDAAYLGPVASDPGGMLQRIDVSRLLPPSIRDSLFQTRSGP